MSTGRLLALVGIAWLGTGCTLLNGGDPCEGVHGREHIVNWRGERDEGFPRAPGLARLPDGTTLLAFDARHSDAQDRKLDKHAVRLARLGASGSSTYVCAEDTSALDRDANGDTRDGADDAHVRWGGIVVPVEPPSDLLRANALVAWTEELEPEVPSKSRMLFRYLEDGCPVGVGDAFDAFQKPARAGTVAWSARRNDALAVMQDDVALWTRWLGSTSGPPMLPTARASAPNAQILDYPSLAFVPSGEGMIAWFDTVEGFQTLLLGPSGEVIRGPTSAGIDAKSYDENNGVSYAVAAGSDRFALVVSALLAPAARSIVFVREFSIDGSPLGPARRVDPDDTGAQLAPNAAYLPSGTLLVTWHAAAQAGTMGRFFRRDGAPRFCTLGCDEGPFVLGSRSGSGSGASAAALVGDDLWVVHVGSDAIGTGVYLWQAPFRELYPASD